MEAYKFETTVSENGIIQLLEISDFASQVVKQPNNQADGIEKQMSEQFTDKWTGFLKGINPDDSKFQYLIGKLNNNRKANHHASEINTDIAG